MKNKRLLYILFPAALLIWGIIFYRVADTLDTSDYDSINGVAQTKEVESDGPTKDTLQLLADYRDPFLDQAAYNAPDEYVKAVHSPSVSSPISIAPQPPVVVPNAIVWPVIEYLGMIHNKQTGSTIALIRFGEKQLFLKETESIHTIFIEQILKDSIKVTFQKESKFIKKQ